MTGFGTAELLGAFLVFCRVGGCLMIAPGLSSNRIPMRIRLYVALAISVACAPLVMPHMPDSLAEAGVFDVAKLIIGESLIGFVFGFMGRVYFFALQTLGNAMAMGIGFSGIPGAPVADEEALPAAAGLLTLAATALLFIFDLHYEIIRGLLISYDSLKPGNWFGPRISLLRMVDQTTSAFLAALRLCAPFIIYSIMINLAVGFANKMTPQIPAFFIATPFIMFGGLFAMYYLTPELLTLFMDAFRTGIAFN